MRLEAGDKGRKSVESGAEGSGVHVEVRLEARCKGVTALETTDAAEIRPRVWELECKSKDQQLEI